MNVVFVNMPFGSLRPAIGVSLLKGHLERMGITSRVAYLNVAFAARIGLEAYLFLSDLAPNQLLLGDWIFSDCVSESPVRPVNAYLDMVRERFPLQEGHEPWNRDELVRVRQSTAEYLDECVTSVDWGACDLVGFSTSFAQNASSLALARRLRERFPHLTIVFGGANCEGEMGMQLHHSFPWIDFVCGGEADISFPLLVERLRSGGEVHGIPGVISRRDGESFYTALSPEPVRDMDTLPYPNYDDYFEQLAAMNVKTGARWVLMETSRGCWWGEKSHCTFCGLNGLSMTYRAKSRDRALEEILYLTERYQTPYVEMVDNILDMRYFRDLLPELKRRQIHLELFYETKANLTKEQVQLMRDAGVTQIQPGIESFDTNVLRLMRKGTSAMQNIQLLKWCKEFGIQAHWNLLFGFPGEEPGEYEEMAALLDGLHHLAPPSGCGPIRLDRFSPNFVHAEEMGLCNVRPDRAYGFVYDLDRTELGNLAYYFEHDYADGRRPESYARPVIDAVERWRSDADRSGLVYADDGEILTLQDFRVGSARFSTVLTDWQRDIYLFCDQNRSRRQIIDRARELGRGPDEAEHFLHHMLEARLMAAADGRLISLAVPAVASGHTEDRPAPALSVDEMQRLQQRLQAWGSELSPRERDFLGGFLDDVGASAVQRR